MYPSEFDQTWSKYFTSEKKIFGCHGNHIGYHGNQIQEILFFPDSMQKVFLFLTREMNDILCQSSSGSVVLEKCILLIASLILISVAMVT